MDSKQVHRKAGKEEEKGEMEQRWYHFDIQGNAQFLDSVPVECTNPCLFVGAVAWVGDP
jgi:hypothetical protein